MLHHPLSPDDLRWLTICQRDKAQDGHFVHRVASTGIYCRPSCSSRLPNIANVRLLDNETYRGAPTVTIVMPPAWQAWRLWPSPAAVWRAAPRVGKASAVPLTA